MLATRPSPSKLPVTDLHIQELIAAIAQADSSTRLIDAVRALTLTHSAASIPTLIQVLGYNNPGAAVTALRGLVQLGEVAVQPLLDQLDGYNYGARAYSIRALAAIADPRALETLLEAAETDFAPSVRRAATKGLGCLRWHQLPVEQIADAQARALKTLLLVSHDPDWAIRYAAVVGLQELTPSWASTQDAMRLVCDRLDEMVHTDPTLTTQARARLARHHLCASSNQDNLVRC